MASIKTTIELRDRISGALKTVATNISNARNRMQGLNEEMERSSAISGRLAGAIGGLVGAYGALQGIASVTRLTDEFTNTNARLNQINDGLQTTQELQDKIFASAQRARSSYSQTADQVAKLAANASDAFKSNDEIILFAENLGKIYAIAGTNAESIESANLQLTQALGSGVLRGEELNAVFEAAPQIIQLIADYLGVSIGEIRNLASEGKISADVVRTALLAATEDINKQFEAMPRTFGQSIQLIKNGATRAFQPIFQQLSRLASSDQFTQIIKSTVNNLAFIANITAQAFSVLGTIASFIYENWSLISPILFTVAAAVGFLITQFVLLRTWTLLVAAAQAVLDATLVANPITLVVLAVIALIGAFVFLINVINRFAGTTISAVGVVVAAFVGLYTYLYNIFTFFLSLFLTVAEFLGNVFTNPIYSVQALFANLANTVLDYMIAIIGSFDNAATALANAFVSGANIAISAIDGLIGALNKIPGIDIGKVGKIGKIGSVTSGLKGIKSKINNAVGPAPSNYTKLNNPLQYKDLGKSISSGYQSGKNFSSKLKVPDFLGNLSASTPGSSLADLMKGVGDVSNKVADAGKAAKDGNKAGNKTADNTKKLADSAGILVDDLKYLRDLSEREAINRYTTASINVQMQNDMNVNSGLDLDGIVAEFGQKMEEVSQVLATGGTINVV